MWLEFLSVSWLICVRCCERQRIAAKLEADAALMASLIRAKIGLRRKTVGQDAPRRPRCREGGLDRGRQDRGREAEEREDGLPAIQDQRRNLRLPFASPCLYFGNRQQRSKCEGGSGVGPPLVPNLDHRPVLPRAVERPEGGFGRRTDTTFRRCHRAACARGSAACFTAHGVPTGAERCGRLRHAGRYSRRERCGYGSR
jgi:hypothetical protein